MLQQRRAVSSAFGGSLVDVSDQSGEVLSPPKGEVLSPPKGEAGSPRYGVSAG